MIVRPWETGDTERIILQESQGYMEPLLENFNVEPLADHGFAWTGETDEGVVIIAGVSPQWENRATAWALVSPLAGPHFAHIHKAVVRHLKRMPFRRIEATVDVGFKPGARWMRLLGFECEGLLRAYRPDGGDQLMFARINHDGT